MKRRRQWTILILVLLPSMIGIAALSWTRLADDTPEHAVPAAIHGAQDADEAIEGAPLQSVPSAPDVPGADVPGSTAPPPAINATEQEPGEVEDPERRPLIPTVMLADNHAAPAADFDSFATAAVESSRRHWGVARSYGGVGGGAFGGGLGGGSGGSGPSAGPEANGDVGDTEERIENLSGDNRSGSQSEPTVPQTDGGSSPGNQEIDGEGGGNDDPPRDSNDEPPPGEPPSADPHETGNKEPGTHGGYPFDPLPQDLLSPIDNGAGDGFGEEPKPHVSVPEPSTWGLFGIALLGAALSRRKKS